jgi:hypothetical protein
MGPCILSPVSADHTQTFRSSLPETTILLSAEKLSAWISCVCPTSGPYNNFPFSACQIITARFFEAVATSRPLGEIETDRMPTRFSEFPSKGTLLMRPLSTLHIELLEPSLVTILEPSSRGTAARNIPVPPGEFFKSGRGLMSKSFIEQSSPPNQYS